ncbi:MAG TPA: FadR/GntR family transcriptional regulator [Conexibacter sp.]|jgi:GntR family transcriptional repressor for pyruvate dehydrogenase complex
MPSAQEPTGFRPRRLSRASAATQIADQVRDAILRGELPAGSRLPAEHELAEQFVVSRATVREAIKLLSAARLVESTRGAAGGTFVVVPDPAAVAASIGDTLSLWFASGSTSLAEVSEAREAIERVCVRLAAQRRDEEDLADIRRAVEGGRDPEIDSDAFLRHDLEFHIAICRAAKNQVLELPMTAIHLIRPWTNTVVFELLDLGQIADQHQAILDAIEAADGDEAERAFDRHIAYLAELRAEALHERPETDVPIASLVAQQAHPALARLRPRG